MNNKRKVLIVGNGASAWMTAAYLQKSLNTSDTNNLVDISIVESPDVDSTPATEATIPSIKHLLSVIGISEIDFMKATDATFKQSTKYVNWLHKDNHFYHHPFSRTQLEPIDYSAKNWLASDRKIPFMESCSEQPLICEMGLSPVMLGQWNMGAPLSYAYHVNAQKFADLLRGISISRGVKHIRANVTNIEMKNSQHITAIHTDTGQKIEADLFVDCTGFRAQLVEKALDVGFEDCSQWLLCDRTVVMDIPYDKYYPGMVRPYTTATALSNGWIWDIPMQSQRSIGYVHSSAFISKEQAEREMRAYQGPGCEELPSRFINFKVGRRHKTWHGNCIAIGLSGGFIEPLESTGLYLSDLGAVTLAEYFPHSDSHIEQMAFRYNRILSNRFYEILDFINMHYCLSQRTDTEFWKTVQQPEHINDRLKAKLDFWKKKAPSASDFDDQLFLRQSQSLNNPDIFGDDKRVAVDTAALWNHENYECILYGMGFLPDQYTHKPTDKLPGLQVHPYIINRLKQAQVNLPPHDIWLKRRLGMSNYTSNQKPIGWI